MLLSTVSTARTRPPHSVAAMETKAQRTVEAPLAAVSRTVARSHFTAFEVDFDSPPLSLNLIMVVLPGPPPAARQTTCPLLRSMLVWAFMAEGLFKTTTAASTFVLPLPLLLPLATRTRFVVTTVVIGAIGSVLLSSATALLYIDIRMRKEGLDLDLQRVVEERAAGLDPQDPYEAAARPDASYGTPGGA